MRLASGISAGIPRQVGNVTKAEIWEQCAYAFKAIRSGQIRSVALEFDYVDVHKNRSQQQMETMAKQAVLPLARLIEQLKLANMYNETTIAMYSTDGGRAPNASSSGNVGKNTVVVAGGRVNGGYYGDVSIDEDILNSGNLVGHKFRYHRPDPETGTPHPTGTLGNDTRTSGASIWKSVLKAAGIDAQFLNQFPDSQGPDLNFL
jgi:hypothetical protein